MKETDAGETGLAEADADSAEAGQQPLEWSQFWQSLTIPGTGISRREGLVEEVMGIGELAGGSARTRGATSDRHGSSGSGPMEALSEHVGFGHATVW